MKTVVIAVGSRGDVLPHVHFAQRLSRSGYDLVLATTDDQLPLALDVGMPVVSVAPGVRFEHSRQLRDESRRARFENPLGALSELQTLMRDLAEPMGGVLDDLVDDGDVVLHGVLGAGAAIGLAATRTCRVAQVTFAATVPTAHGASYISPLFPSRVSRMNLAASRAAHRLFMGLSSPPGRVIADRHGRELAGGVVHRQILANPTLIATSPLLAPPAADWPDRVVLTGAWLPSSAASHDAAAIPSDLREFLVAGPPPVYIGFGSAVARDPLTDLRMFAEAARRAGVRAVIRRSDWLTTDIPPELGDDVIFVDTVPHEWLFPQMAAVVHHGGAGTTLAALRAARPSTIVWHNVDQPFHGRRCAELGVGPLGIPKKHLTVERLCALLTDLAGPNAQAYGSRAAEAAAQLADEDGLRRAINALREWQFL